MEEQKVHVESPVMRILAVFGLVAILGVGLWGSVKLVEMMPDNMPSISKRVSAAAASLSSIFIPAERLTLSTEKGTVNSGDILTLSFEHKGARDEGSYAFSYECRPGVSVQTPKVDGTYETVTCDTNFPISTTAESGAVKVITASDANRYVDVPFTVSFTKEGETTNKVADRLIVTVVNSSVMLSNATTTPTGPEVADLGTKKATDATPTTPKKVTPGVATTNTYQIPTSGGVTSNPLGRADLAVKFIDVGYIDSATKAFVSSSSPMVSQKIAVKFEIANLGDKETGEWTFSSVLPTTPHHIFQSQMQRNLLPGDKIEFTLAFDQAKNEKELVVMVNVDNARPLEPSFYGSVKESNEKNNIASYTINATAIR